MRGNIGSILGKGRDPRSVVAGESIEHTHLCGVEVEMVGLADCPVLVYWDAKRDGSIRGAGAMELTFTTPLGGADIESALEELASFVSTQPRAGVNYSCSTHVHLDVRDLTPQELARLIVCYLVFERGLYRLAGEGRYLSPFCAPLYSINNFVYDVASGAGEEWVSRAGNFGRYAGLNLAALERFGSLEFRHLEGTLDTQRIKEWINLAGSLKTYAQQGGDCYEILLRTSASYVELCESIFGKRAPLFMYPAAEEDSLKGSRMAQDFLYLYDAFRRSPLQNEEDRAVEMGWCAPGSSGHSVATKYQRNTKKSRTAEFFLGDLAPNDLHRIGAELFRDRGAVRADAIPDPEGE